MISIVIKTKMVTQNDGKFPFLLDEVRRLIDAGSTSSSRLLWCLIATKNQKNNFKKYGRLSPPIKKLNFNFERFDWLIK